MTNVLNYIVDSKTGKKTIEMFFDTENPFYNERDMQWLLDRYMEIFKDYNIIAKRISDGKEITRI